MPEHEQLRAWPGSGGGTGQGDPASTRRGRLADTVTLPPGEPAPEGGAPSGAAGDPLRPGRLEKLNVDLLAVESDPDSG